MTSNLAAYPDPDPRIPIGWLRRRGNMAEEACDQFLNDLAARFRDVGQPLVYTLDIVCETLVVESQ